MISMLLALLAALGGNLIVPSDVSGVPITVTSGPVSGGMHTSDVSGGPTGHS